MWKARGWFRTQEACLFVCFAVLRKEGESSFYQISKNCMTILPKINQKKKPCLLCFCFSDENKKGRVYSLAC